MKIDRKAIEKEPWLKAFTENANMVKETTKEEDEEIEEIRKRMSSEVLRCVALKDNGESWKKGDTVGIREIDSEKFIKSKMLKIIK